MKHGARNSLSVVVAKAPTRTGVWLELCAEAMLRGNAMPMKQGVVQSVSMVAP
jgi:hypothetical protein